MPSSVDTRGSLLERLRRPGDEEAWARFVRLYTPLRRPRRVGRQRGDRSVYLAKARVLRRLRQELAGMLD